MNVYVLNTHGKALMPTTPQRARLLLKEGKAKIQNYGDYIKLAGLPKPVKTSLVMPICWRKGICRKAEAWTTRGNTTHK